MRVEGVLRDVVLWMSELLGPCWEWFYRLLEFVRSCVKKFD